MKTIDEKEYKIKLIKGKLIEVEHTIVNKDKINEDLPRVVSLFSGCGGLDLGFTNSGFNVVCAIDINKKLI